MQEDPFMMAVTISPELQEQLKQTQSKNKNKNKDFAASVIPTNNKQTNKKNKVSQFRDMLARGV